MSVPAETVPVLGVKPHEWEQVEAILQKHLPGKRVWAFGSRATGKVLKRFSDLDLAVEGTLSWSERSAVSDAFEESLLPFKVDVVELDMVDTEFRERIAKDFVVVQGVVTGLEECDPTHAPSASA